jgi:aromatic-L-amino-acid decarboxylase
VAEPLSLPPEEMRRLGYRVVDRIVDHLGELRDLPPIRVGDARELRTALGGPPPEAAGDPDAALDALFEQVLPYVQAPDHPRFFARIGSPGNYMSVLADALTSGFNVFTGSWTGGSGPATVELVVLDWLRELCGLPDGAEGVLVTGGSVASLVALAAARTARLGDRAPQNAVAYVSSEGHASIPRALRILGIGHVRTVTAGADCRLAADAVRAAIEADRAAGLEPFCVVGTAGTTSTGAVDPLGELADLGLWLHLDGAYGAPAALTEPGRALPVSY